MSTLALAPPLAVTLCLILNEEQLSSIQTIYITEINFLFYIATHIKYAHFLPNSEGRLKIDKYFIINKLLLEFLKDFNVHLMINNYLRNLPLRQRFPLRLVGLHIRYSHLEGNDHNKCSMHL